jgi:hypothetical protein
VFHDVSVSCVAGFGRFAAGGGGGLYSLFPGPGGGGGASDASGAIYSQATTAARFAHSANTYHNFIGAHKGNCDVTCREGM